MANRNLRIHIVLVSCYKLADEDGEIGRSSDGTKAHNMGPGKIYEGDTLSLFCACSVPVGCLRLESDLPLCSYILPVEVGKQRKRTTRVPCCGWSSSVVMNDSGSKGLRYA